MTDRDDGYNDPFNNSLDVSFNVYRDNPWYIPRMKAVAESGAAFEAAVEVAVADEPVIHELNCSRCGRLFPTTDRRNTRCPLHPRTILSDTPPSTLTIGATFKTTVEAAVADEPVNQIDTSANLQPESDHNTVNPIRKML